MAKMVATKSFKYGTRNLVEGDEFDTDEDGHVMLLVVADKAVRKKEPDARVKRKYERRDMRADD